MSRTTKQELYKLSPEVVGKADEQVTRTLRKGLPDEYSELLERGRVDTRVMVDEELARAANIYVPKLYNILIKNDYPPKSARNIIIEDGRHIWSKGHVLKYLPEETKDLVKKKAGKISSEKRIKKSEQELEQFVEDVKDIVPGAPEADRPTKKLLKKLGKTKIVGLASPKVTSAMKTRITTKAGNTTKEKHPEQYHEMGLKSAEVRWGYGQQLFELAINKEEHKEMVNAYEQSIEAGGGGCYTIYVKDGEFDRVEADLNGKPEKTVNK